MSEVQSGTSKSGYQWQRMNITLEIPGYQGSVTKQVFQVSGDEVNNVLLFSIGDKVEVSWSMYAREWNGRWFNNIDLVKIKYQDEKPYNPAPAPDMSNQVEDSDPSEDLPF